MQALALSKKLEDGSEMQTRDMGLLDIINHHLGKANVVPVCCCLYENWYHVQDQGLGFQELNSTRVKDFCLKDKARIWP